VERVKKLLLAKGYDAGEIKTMEKKVKKEVDSAVEESKVGAAAMADACGRRLPWLS
jgi:TPP-dependent pyruvate/acetoin dehydrogenase alpha subunit